MANKVVLQVDADASKSISELQKIVRKQGEVIAELKKTSRTSKQVAKDGDGITKGFKTAKTAAMSLATSIGLVGGGAGILLGTVKLITSEMERQREIQKEAESKQITLNSARMDINRNMSGASRESLGSVFKSVAAMAKEENIDEKYLASAMASALSSSGGNVDASLKAVRKAAQFLADKPEEIADFAGSLLDVSDVTKTTDADINLGLVSAVGGLSRVKDARQQAVNIPKALVGIQGMDATAEGAAALFATLSNAGKDVMGASSGTAGISLAEQLRGFFKDKKLDRPGQTMTQRIRALVKNKKLRDEFLEGASIEKQFLAPMEQLLSGQDVYSKYESMLKKIPKGEELKNLGQQAISNRTVDPLEKVAATKRAYDSATGQLQTSNDDAVVATHREGLQKTMKAAGVPGLEAKINSLLFEGKTFAGDSDAYDVAKSLIQEEIQKLQNPTTTSGGHSVGMDSMAVLPSYERREPTAREEKQAEILSNMLDVLIKINTAQNTAVLKSEAAAHPQTSMSGGIH